ncbi:NF-kappa-B essential modulator-like isoform X1 [Melanerpes formicivorus]|uniref:NF-kappa-B essential modulator-like isoform X1 n=1 Tax=Melanerpes formicivorus TaxID=211600 RepID=UPI00358E5259
MSGGRWRKPPAEMVQPGGSGPEGTGGGGGAGTGAAEAGDEAAAAVVAADGGVPLEVTSAEVLQRLLVENRELKAALRRSSEGLRGRCEELRRLRAAARAERELLRGCAGQARALVGRLRAERDQERAGRDGSGATSTAATPPADPQEEEAPQDPQDVTKPPPFPPDSSSTEQLQQRLAVAEAELVAARGAVAEAEARAEQQLQALRRQLEQDKAAVKAQVTSLLGELRESQARLESSRRQRQELEQRCQEVAAGQALQLDQLRLQVQNLETALRVERQGATEEKRKLVQLQVAYHHLFQEYDAHIKATTAEGDKQGQGPWEELAAAQARLQAAEEALVAKQDLIDRLKAEAERQRAALDTIPVLQAQADIFKADFEAERAAREQLHAQREALQEALEQLRLRLGTDGSPRSRMEELRQRHSDLRPAVPLPGGFGGLRAAPPEEPELSCPKCQYRAPDMDTLQIHVMECIK